MGDHSIAMALVTPIHSRTLRAYALWSSSPHAILGDKLAAAGRITLIIGFIGIA
jgi:hypothetical protein